MLNNEKWFTFRFDCHFLRSLIPPVSLLRMGASELPTKNETVKTTWNLNTWLSHSWIEASAYSDFVKMYEEEEKEEQEI